MTGGISSPHNQMTHDGSIPQFANVQIPNFDKLSPNSTMPQLTDRDRVSKKKTLLTDKNFFYNTMRSGKKTNNTSPKKAQSQYNNSTIPQDTNQHLQETTNFMNKRMRVR